MLEDCATGARGLNTGLHGEERQTPEALAPHGFGDADDAAGSLGDEAAFGIRPQRMGHPVRATFSTSQALRRARTCESFA